MYMEAFPAALKRFILRAHTKSSGFCSHGVSLMTAGQRVEEDCLQFLTQQLRPGGDGLVALGAKQAEKAASPRCTDHVANSSGAQAAQARIFAKMAASNIARGCSRSTLSRAACEQSSKQTEPCACSLQQCQKCQKVAASWRRSAKPFHQRPQTRNGLT
eukprot:s3018_g2.t1